MIVNCKGCFKEIKKPFTAHGGQCFHSLECLLKWMRRYVDTIVPPPSEDGEGGTVIWILIILVAVIWYLLGYRHGKGEK